MGQDRIVGIDLGGAAAAMSVLEDASMENQISSKTDSRETIGVQWNRSNDRNTESGKNIT